MSIRNIRSLTSLGALGLIILLFAGCQLSLNLFFDGDKVAQAVEVGQIENEATT